MGEEEVERDLRCRHFQRVEAQRSDDWVGFQELEGIQNRRVRDEIHYGIYSGSSS